MANTQNVTINGVVYAVQGYKSRKIKFGSAHNTISGAWREDVFADKWRFEIFNDDWNATQYAALLALYNAHASFSFTGLDGTARTVAWVGGFDLTERVDLDFVNFKRYTGSITLQEV